MDGSIANFGHFDACLDARDDERALVGQYCLAHVLLPLEAPSGGLKFHKRVKSARNTFSEVFEQNSNLFYIARAIRVGACVPNTCSREDLKALAQKCIFRTIFETIFDFWFVFRFRTDFRTKNGFSFEMRNKRTKNCFEFQTKDFSVIEINFSLICF